MIKQITSNEIKEYIKNNPKCVLLDVRTEEEWSSDGRPDGEKIGIRPQPDSNEPAYRWNWDSPLIISPHNTDRLYFAANYLFQSDDRGNSWKKISDDLTRNEDRNKINPD